MRRSRWHFEQKGRFWIWREVAANGEIIASLMIKPAEEYGQAVSDAIDHGFSPQQQGWQIISHGQVTGISRPEHLAPKPDEC